METSHQPWITTMLTIKPCSLVAYSYSSRTLSGIATPPDFLGYSALMLYNPLCEKVSPNIPSKLPLEAIFSHPAHWLSGRRDQPTPHYSLLLGVVEIDEIFPQPSLIPRRMPHIYMYICTPYFVSLSGTYSCRARKQNVCYCWLTCAFKMASRYVAVPLSVRACSPA